MKTHLGMLVLVDGVKNIAKACNIQHKPAMVVMLARLAPMRLSHLFAHGLAHDDPFQLRINSLLEVCHLL